MKFLLIIVIVVLVYCLITFKSKNEYFAQTHQINQHKTAIEFPLPPGSWKEKCDLINWKHPYLWARCWDDLRHPHNNVINIHNCEDENIHVHNGHLECH